MNYRSYARSAARRHGIPENLFLTLIHFESGWQKGIVSPAGAIGFTQLMPGTARGLGVDPWNPRQNIDGGARYLSQAYKHFGSWKLALAAYNAGWGAVKKYGGVPPYAQTQDYVKNILAAAGDITSPSGGRGRPARTAPTGAPTGAAPIDFSNVALDNLSHMAAGSYSPEGSLSALTDAVAAAGGPRSSRQPRQAPASTGGFSLGKVTLGPSADRAGVHTHEDVLAFARKVAGFYGKPLTVGTGTNHSRMTVDGNVSDHWSGHAVDIPATGASLTRLGFSALLAAGVPRAQARKMARTGGLFNVGRYQIIFKTTQGGNHWNHLHIGIHH